MLVTLAPLGMGTSRRAVTLLSAKKITAYVSIPTYRLYLHVICMSAQNLATIIQSHSQNNTSNCPVLSDAPVALYHIDLTLAKRQS